MIYPWQHDDWIRLQALRDRWPHAVLLQGPEGIGKADFARRLAQAMLCETPVLQDTPNKAHEPCGNCAACTLFLHGNHPDYRLIVPESLACETLPEKGAPADDTPAGSHAANDHDSVKKTKALSHDIKIEQVRALLDFCMLSAHRGRRRVVVLHPAEALNTAAANALLKMLEEPPAGVVFILVANHLDRMLPTIISRCRRWPLSTPSPDAALSWLQAQLAQFAQPVSAAEVLLAEAGGAPLRALALATQPERALQPALLEQLAAGSRCDVLACGERLQKISFACVLDWLQRWLFDLSALKHAQPAQGGARYYPSYAHALARCAQQSDTVLLARFARLAYRQQGIAHHPLNARLAIEELLLHYRAIFTDTSEHVL